jgi:RND superfamily putative drug exporter
MRQLAAFCYDKRWFVVVGWIVLLVGLFALSTAFKGEYRTKFELPASESARGIDLLKERGVGERAGFTGQIVFKSDNGVNDPQVRRTMEDFFAQVQGAIDDVQIVSPYDSQNTHQISKDGKIAYAEVNISDRSNEQLVKDGKTVRALWKQINQPGLQVELGGDIFAEFQQVSTEFIGIGAAVIILIIAFGSLLAMGLPIATALFGVGCGAALISLLTRVLDVPDFTGQVAALIGIGVGIDYALLITSRYRQALRDRLEPRDAVLLSLDTSGRSIVFAGVTVVISLLGMFMMNLDFMRSLSLAAIATVLMTMLAAVTLLPALLGFVGRNIDRFGLPHRKEEAEGEAERSFWYRWSRVIQAHPWPALLISTGILLACIVPVFSLRLGFGDAGNRLETDTTRRAYDLLSEAFGPGFNSPILIVVDTPGGASDMPKVQQLADAAARTPGVASVTAPQVIPNANLGLFNVYPTTSPQDKETTDLVHRVRKETIPPVAASTGLKVYTTGGPPAVVDFSDYLGRRLLWFIGAVLLLSFLLLLAVFHSVVVPIKAVIMNMLSIGAAFGATVAVFQWGFLHQLFGVGREGPIEAWAPMMLFAILFGLSMD